jgi:hypothetical protein
MAQLIKSICGLSIAALVAASTPAHAADGETAVDKCDCVRDERSPRRLHGHTLILPAYVTSSVVDNHLGTRTGITVLEVPDVPTRIGARSLNVSGVTEAIDVGIRFHDRVSLEITAGGTGILGTNVVSLIYQTGTYNYGGQAGVPVKLYRNEDLGLQVTIRPYGTYYNGKVVSIAPALAQGQAATLDTIISGNLGELVVTPLRGYTAGAALAVAWAPHPMFSLQGSASVGMNSLHADVWHNDIGARQTFISNGVEHRFGLAATGDFEPVHVPIGVQFEYLLTRFRGDDILAAAAELRTTHILSLGFYYTALYHLQFGLVGSVLLNLAPVETPSGTSGTPTRSENWLMLRYGW